MHPHTLMVLRHGETEWNAEGRMQGGLDSPLTRRGIGDARAQGRLIRDQDLSDFTFWSSPQWRALHTASIALSGIADTIHEDERLREIGMGRWAGLLRSEIIARHGTASDFESLLGWYEHAPEGEGLSLLEERCVRFLDDLTGPALVVTHGITSRMLRALSLGLPARDLENLPGGQGVVHVVSKGVHETLG